MSSSSTLPEWFSEALACLQAGDIDGYMSVYAPDAVHEFPWASEGQVHRFEGCDAIAAYMGQLPEFITHRDGKITRWQDYMNPRQRSALAE